MKSPNMMSTIGRIPVIAAPTASPVNPASEIGVSRTRSLPNSSTSPESTLKGVPASATSSPMMQTFGSRRISSLSASRTACANVSSRSLTSGVDMLFHLIGVWIRRLHREFRRAIHLGDQFFLDLFELSLLGNVVRRHPGDQILNWIPFRFPALLFGFRSVIRAIDVADMMTAVSVSVRQDESRAAAVASALSELAGDRMDRTHVLAIDFRRKKPERRGACQDVTRGGLRKMCVLRVQVVLADVNHRQLEQLRKI